LGMVVQALMLMLMGIGEGVECMTTVMRVQERQGETILEPSLCNLSPLSLGSSCLRGGGWSAKNWM
jgi:hypothetical protein